MTDDHSITDDPIYYITAAIFALISTALPAILGQQRFLPILQTLCLTIFVAFTLHHRNSRAAITVMAIWLPIQFAVIALLTGLMPGRLEKAFAEGFTYRGDLLAWFVGGAPFPGGLSLNPVGYLIEFFAITLGSLVSAGLVGIWYLVHLVNRAGFATGILFSNVTNPAFSSLVIPYWTLLRAAGYAGLIVLAAEPLLTYNWSPGYYWHNHRKLILISIGLIILSLVVELFLPGLIGYQRLS
jgi:hypothetical protein